MLKEVKKPLFMKKNAELEDLMEKFEMDASNNYKDNARKWFNQLEELWTKMEDDHTLSDKQHKYYEARMEYYRRHMVNYHH